MSDKFVVSTNTVGEIIVTDTETGNVYHYGSMSNFLGLIRLLNELNDENKELKKENKKLIEEWEFSFRTEMAHHRFAEKELQEKIREKQATIGKLQKENIELKNLRKYCAEWMGVKEENLYDVVR